MLEPPCTSTDSPRRRPRSNRLVQTVKNVSGMAAASMSERPAGTASTCGDGTRYRPA